MKYARGILALLAMASSILLATTPATADQTFYGVVESYGNGEIVVRTANSTGHWKVDGGTRVAGTEGFQPSDWVHVDVEPSGHLRALTFEERPTTFSGVVKTVSGAVLSVRSGESTYQWNIVPTTGFHGVEKGQVAAKDEVLVRVYRNHNLADLQLLKHNAT